MASEAVEAEVNSDVEQKKESFIEANSGNGVGVEVVLSKRALKRAMKKEKYEAKKAEKKAAMKEQKKIDKERKRREWDDMLSNMTDEQERNILIESRREMRKQRMDQRSHERLNKIQRLTKAHQNQGGGAHNIVIDLEFSHLMSPNQIHSLVQQIMYCYSVNGRCSSPAHLCLTGFQGEMEAQLNRLPGFDKWIIDKDPRPYIEAFPREHLVYLTADSDNVLDDDELDPNKFYIVGGLVDRNRWKGITMKKAQEQGIHTAKLPIANYLKLCSSQVLTVNQVVEIILKFLETKDWKTAFFDVIPQRKRSQGHEDTENDEQDIDNDDQLERKRECLESLQSPS